MPCLSQASNGAGGKTINASQSRLRRSPIALTVAAHDLALPVAALFLQLGIEGVPARKPGTRHHKVPPGVANHPFYIAFIVALAGAAVAVLEQVMGLQPAERPGPLPRAVRQDARHQALVVVVENRLGNPAAEGKGRIVASWLCRGDQLGLAVEYIQHTGSR